MIACMITPLIIRLVELDSLALRTIFIPLVEMFHHGTHLVKFGGVTWGRFWLLRRFRAPYLGQQVSKPKLPPASKHKSSEQEAKVNSPRKQTTTDSSGPPPPAVWNLYTYIQYVYLYVRPYQMDGTSKRKKKISPGATCTPLPLSIPACRTAERQHVRWLYSLRPFKKTQFFSF